MGSIDEIAKFRADRKKQNIKGRFNTNTRTIKQSFLIICEGQNTEPDYFNEFKLGSAKVEAVGEGKNTISLVNKALELRKQYKNKGIKFDQHWVVFDKDDCSFEQFNTAVQMAESSGFNVAYSNQAFEFWFILHFNLHQGKIMRTDYYGILSKKLGIKYSKDSGVSKQMFNLLLRSQAIAIRNAKQVYDSFDTTHPSPALEESSTTVFKLVEELNKFI